MHDESRLAESEAALRAALRHSLGPADPRLYYAYRGLGATLRAAARPEEVLRPAHAMHTPCTRPAHALHTPERVHALQCTCACVHVRCTCACACDMCM